MSEGKTHVNCIYRTNIKCIRSTIDSTIAEAFLQQAKYHYSGKRSVAVA
jgi:hypothetical protein